MAKGYVLNTPRRRENPGRRAITMVNPRPRGSTSGWRQARVVTPGVSARRSATSSVEAPARRPKRNPSQSKTAAGRVVPNKAGKKRKTAATPKRATTARTAAGRVVSKKAASRQGASKKTTSRSNTTRTRSQSRNTARKATRVAVTKKRPARKPRRNTAKGRMVRNAIPRWEVDVHPGTGRRGIRGTKMSIADRRVWTKRGIKRSRIAAERAERVGIGATKRVAPRVGAQAGAGRWNQGVMHPVTQRLVGGQLMTARDKKLFKQDGTTRKGVGPAAVKAAYGLPGGKKIASPAKRSTARKTAKRTAAKRKPAKKRVFRKGQRRYRVRGYTKPSTGKSVKSYLRSRPGMKRKTTKSKPGHVWVKGYTRADGVKVKGHWMKATKKKAAPKRRRSIKVKTYKRRAPGGVNRVRKVRAYTRKRPTKRRRIAANPTRRPSKGAVWVKGYTRSDGVKVKGHWMKPAKGKKRAARKAPKTRRVASYLRKVPGRKRRIRVRSYPRKVATKRRTTKRAAPKRRSSTRRVSSYLRKVPGRSRRIRVRGYTKKLPARRRKSTKRAAGKLVKRKGYTRSDGTRVKATSYRLKSGRKTASRGRITRNPKRRVKVSNYRHRPKRSRVRSYRHQPSRVRGYRRNGGSLGMRRNAGRLGMLRNGGSLGMLSNTERAELVKNMRRNQAGGLMALLPASEQLKIVGKKVGVGALGFGGAVAMGVALNRVPMLTQYLGTWTPVLGNVAAGLGYWAIATAMDDPRLKDLRVPVAVGAGLAAVFNIANNLVARQTIPSGIAAWFLPGAGAIAAAPTEMVEPTNGNGSALTNGNGAELTNGNGDGTSGFRGFGQIDVYEAALDGFGGIEEELEMEMSHMGGMGDGVFDTSPDGIFDGMSGAGEYLSVPLNGMGAQVEEAFAGGTGEYLQVPMGEYLQVPMGGMGAQVEEAFAGGTGEYLQVPMGEYLQVPMGGMGAQVEEAYAGMGQDNGATSAQVEQSLRNHPLMPGFRTAVQQMVRKRIAAGQPLDQAFYAQVGQAASNLARKKFDQRVALVGGTPGGIATQPWKAPLLRSSAPTYMKPVGDPRMVPGIAEPIPGVGMGEGNGIFSEEDDDGIF